MTDAVAAGYDSVYAAWQSSPRFHALWAEHAVQGDIDPGFEHLNFAPVAEMERIAADLVQRRDGHLLDVACGAGGPGLWVARASSARLVGIDLSKVGTRLARVRARALGIDTARFAVASATHIALADSCVDAVMSIDSLQYVSDKLALFTEIARVLRPAGRVAFTAFELDAERVAGLPVLGDDPVSDYTPLLEAAGLVVDRYEETLGWEARLEAAYGAVVAAEAELRPEMGNDAVDALMLEMTLTLAVHPYCRRVFATARRP